MLNYTKTLYTTILLVSVLILSSCCRDPNAPSLYLNGPAYITVIKGEPYVEQGATAIDIEDGDITGSIEITGTVDADVIEEYIIYYSVQDDCDNINLKERVVDVSYAASTLVDTVNTLYMTLSDCSSVSDTSYYNLSNKNLFELLVIDFDQNYFRGEVRIDIAGSDITIPLQSNATEDTSIAGSGMFINDTTIKFTYEITTASDGINCTSTATKM